jgi:hypothetical protein
MMDLGQLLGNSCLLVLRDSLNDVVAFADFTEKVDNRE